MVKADLKLKNGTTVTIEGTPEEVERLLQNLGMSQPGETHAKVAEKESSRRDGRTQTQHKDASVDHASLANLVKSCDEAERIETRILDRVALENRVLLPLYIAHVHLGEDVTLTSGDVNKITTQLRIPVDQAAASRCLGASGLVMGNSVRKKGRPVGYKLNRRGVKHFETLLGVKETAPESDTQDFKPSRASRKAKRDPQGEKGPQAAVENRRRMDKPKSNNSGQRPGPGALIDQLVQEGYFKQGRTISAIRDHAKAMLARSYKATDLSPALTRALRSKKVHRTRNSEGQYEYRQA